MNPQCLSILPFEPCLMNCTSNVQDQMIKAYIKSGVSWIHLDLFQFIYYQFFPYSHAIVISRQIFLNLDHTNGWKMLVLVDSIGRLLFSCKGFKLLVPRLPGSPELSAPPCWSFPLGHSGPQHSCLPSRLSQLEPVQDQVSCYSSKQVEWSARRL